MVLINDHQNHFVIFGNRNSRFSGTSYIDVKIITCLYGLNALLETPYRTDLPFGGFLFAKSHRE